MRHLYYLLAVFLVASCASANVAGPQPESLAGVFTHRACPSTEYHSDAVPTLLLDSPVFVDGLGLVDSVDLILDEPEFVQYPAFIDKHGTVTCSALATSALCGPAVDRASCGVSSVKVAP